MKKFFFLAILFICSTSFAESSQPIWEQEAACKNEFKTAALKLIQAAQTNGFSKAHDLKLSKLAQQIENEEIHFKCTFSLNINISGRSSAFYVTSKVKNSQSYITRWLRLTKKAHESPAYLHGALLIHEFLGGLGYDDNEYQYSALIYKMAHLPAENPTLAKQLLEKPLRFAGGEGTSTGVGGGDWRILALKLNLLDKLAADSLADPSISFAETVRRFNFLLTLNIELANKSFFSNQKKDTAIGWLIYKYNSKEAENRQCNSRRAPRVFIREDLFKPDIQFEVNIEEYIYKFITPLIQKKQMGENATCIL
jgi:hypothetical protein